MTRLSERREMALSDPAVGLELQSMRDAYEANFSECSEIEPPKYFTISELPGAVDSLIYPGECFEHREVAGTGNTAQEAMDDWKSWLDKCPQAGKKLLWRVPPEIDCWCDFPSDKLIWKVYARMAIIYFTPHARPVVPLLCGRP